MPSFEISNHRDNDTSLGASVTCVVGRGSCDAAGARGNGQIPNVRNYILLPHLASLERITNLELLCFHVIFPSSLVTNNCRLQTNRYLEYPDASAVCLILRTLILASS